MGTLQSVRRQLSEDPPVVGGELAEVEESPVARDVGDLRFVRIRPPEDLPHTVRSLTPAGRHGSQTVIGFREWSSD